MDKVTLELGQESEGGNGSLHFKSVNHEVDVQIAVYTILSLTSQTRLSLFTLANTTGSEHGHELSTQAESKVLSQVDVLPLRVVIKHILLNFISFRISIILVKILEVILHELIRKVPVSIAADQEAKDDLDRSNDTSNVSQQVQNRVHPTAINNFLIVKEQADTHDGASHCV
jgi:hypothetical protein